MSKTPDTRLITETRIVIQQTNEKNRDSFKLESSSRYCENIYKTAPKATNWPDTDSRNQNAQKQGANIAYAFS